MITPDEVRAKAARQYLAFLRSWLRGDLFMPLRLPAGAPPTEYGALQTAVTTLLDGARMGGGYRVESQTRQTRTLGTQSIPSDIWIDTADDLLALCGKRQEFAQFCADVALIRVSIPQLEGWLPDNTQRVIENAGVWPELLRVCAYFVNHPRPGLYIRELPVAVHTKFIETHTGILRRLLDHLLAPESISFTETEFPQRYGLRYDEPLIRMRLLDPTIRTRFGGVLTDISAPLRQFAALDLRGCQCIIVENKMTFLTLPPLPNTFALFGGGFGVELLKQIIWLHDCRLFYWGDLDAQGFQILAQLRAFFPQTISVMMDAATLTAFRPFVVTGTPCAVSLLPNLTPDEHTLFVQLAQSQLRLEQERISQAFAVERLGALMPT